MVQDTKRSGPVPIGCWLKPVNPTRSIYVHGTTRAPRGESSRDEYVRSLRVDDERFRVGGLGPVDRLEQRQQAGRLHRRVERSVETVLGVDGGEPSAVVPPHVRPQREVPRGRPRALPGGRQARAERAVGMAPHEGVEEVGDDAAVGRVARRVGIERGEVAPLEHDQVALLRGVGGGPRRASGQEPGRPRPPVRSPHATEGGHGDRVGAAAVAHSARSLPLISRPP